MKLAHWLVHEFRLLVVVTVYFATWFALVLVLKHLLLEEYGINFLGLSTALLVALVTAKVVLALENMRLGRWFESGPTAADVLARTALYTFATIVLLMVEKIVEGRAAAGGLMASARGLLGHPDLPQIWATAICVGLAFLAYNIFGALRRHVGDERLRQIFLARRVAIDKG